MVNGGLDLKRMNSEGGDMGEHKKKEQIRIEADKQITRGMYSNYAMVSHGPNEFMLDFFFIQPQSSNPKTGTLLSRIITSPAHMKSIFSAIGKNIDKYEKQFGEIKEAAPAAPGETTLIQ